MQHPPFESSSSPAGHPVAHRAGASRIAVAGSFALLTLGACMPMPYGPPIPEPRTSRPAPVASTRGEAPVGDTAVVAAGALTAPGARTVDSVAARSVPTVTRSPLATPSRFRSRQDSLAWVAARRQALADKGLRVLVSLDARTLWVLKGQDTLRVAPVAIGTEKRLEHGKESWVFETPRGARRVRGKAADPTWTPPKWHYVEMAQKHGLKLAVMPANGRVKLPNGDRLEVRDSLVGRWKPGRGWRALPVDDEIVVDGTLYMPPIGTKNRIQHGQLGPYKLDLAEGYLIHGSPDQSSIGRAVTHGCIRLADEDLSFVYGTVPVGTPVYIL